jgi:hypothetical protein
LVLDALLAQHPAHLGHGVPARVVVHHDRGAGLAVSLGHRPQDPLDALRQAVVVVLVHEGPAQLGGRHRAAHGLHLGDGVHRHGLTG